MAVAVLGVGAAAPAGAMPAACPQPVADRYEPGDEVMLVGYTHGCVPEIAGEAAPLSVGIDFPGSGRGRAWPLDDPAIEDLADDALVLGVDGDPVTAAEVRALPPDERGELGDRAKAAGQPELDEHDVAIADDPAESPDASSEDEGPGGLLGLTAVVLVIGAAALAVRLGPTRHGGGRKQIRRGPPRP